MRDLPTMKDTSKDTYKRDLYTTKENGVGDIFKRPIRETTHRDETNERPADEGKIRQKRPTKEICIRQKRPIRETTRRDETNKGPTNYPLYATLQDTARHCKTLQDTARHCKTLQDTARHCKTLQDTATHCNTLE